MALGSGTRLGPFEIVATIGAGGMGEVYRAHDTKLNRDVALKVLPDQLAADADRLARFRREAQVLAALNHPNIAHIHGFEDAPSTTSGPAAVHAIVMELVEGPTLADRIAAGPIPLDEALEIARQVAEALEAAHEQGIVHRDLKPANIKVRDDGTVKVLDFGLAKALTPESAGSTPDVANSPTLTARATQLGVILGTAGYMAPEQAAGKAVDRRADVWAFGVVLWEMLSGRRLFEGETVSHVVAAVLRDDIDLAALPPSTPPRVRQLLTRCLDRNVKTRLQHIGEARIALSSDDGVPSSFAAAAPVPARRLWLVPALALALVGATTTVAALLWNRTAAPAAPPTHVSLAFIDIPQPQKGRPIPSLAVSPDGRAIVYTAFGPEGNQLWLRTLDGFEPTPIRGTPGRAPAYSPDGRWIAYQNGQSIMKVATTFDPPTTVATTPGFPLGCTWTDRDEIVFATSGPSALWRVAASGGTPAKVADGYFSWPDSLPGGTAVIATVLNAAAARSADELTIARVDLETGTVTRLLDGGTFARWVPSGHLVFLRGNSLVATTYDPSTGSIGEMRVSVVDDLFMDPATTSGSFALSASGTLVFSPGTQSNFERTIVAIDPGRPASQPESVVDAARYYGVDFSVSPDGRRLAAVERAWRERIRVIDLERRTSYYLTPDPGNASQGTPVWSPDGRSIAYRATDLATRQQSLLRAEVREGGSPSEVLMEDSGGLWLTGWTPDGRSLVAATGAPGAGFNVVRVTPGANPEMVPLVEKASLATYSPDGQWLAVSSGRSGRNEVYVSRTSTPGELVRVSLDGGDAPEWAPGGRRLYFVSHLAGGSRLVRQVMGVDFAPGTDPSPGRPFPVATVTAVEPWLNLEALPDGRLLVLDGNAAADAPELRVILNWFDELKAKVK